MHIYLPLCWFNRHAPKGRRANWDGMNYTSTCAYCAKPIRRIDRHKWQNDWRLEARQ